MVNGSCHLLIVKSPQIFDGAAAPAHNQQIRQFIMVCIGDGCGNLPGGFRSLHPDRQKPHLSQGVPFSQNPQHIVKGRSGGTCDDADGAGIGRQGLFMLRGKQPLGRELLFQLLKGRIQVPHSVQCHGGTVKLVGTVSGVYGDSAHGDDLHTIFRTEFQLHSAATEHDALQCTAFILQGEIVMAGRIHFIIADFTPDCKTCQKAVLIHEALDVSVYLGYGKNLLLHIIPPWLCG